MTRTPQDALADYESLEQAHAYRLENWDNFQLQVKRGIDLEARCDKYETALKVIAAETADVADRHIARQALREVPSE